jgi:fluoride exporter
VTVLLVALGAAVGAPVRYLVDRAMAARFGRAFPWGTFAVNVAGCLLLGALAGSGTVPAEVLTLVGTGFCGALTTYSTFAWESMTLAGRGQWVRAGAYVLGSTAAGLGAAALGWALVN